MHLITNIEHGKEDDGSSSGITIGDTTLVEKDLYIEGWDKQLLLLANFNSFWYEKSAHKDDL